MAQSPRIEAAADSSKLVRSALETARRAHAGQIRNGSGGMPYIDHPTTVAELLAENGFDEGVLAAALLHDVVEESAIEVAEIRESFGEPIASLVEALTDEETIEDYRERKKAHRRQVEEAGAEARAIYAADKLANIRALRRVYAGSGEAIGDELKAPLDDKVAVWEADVALLRRRDPELPFLSRLEDQLAGLRADRVGAAQAHAS
ncbi:MAG TPA: HD domain-containing protein [Solirubrobacterales bacterium]